MRTTITQIAREAGVSPATVDRVLNDRDGVRARTREVVMQVAAQLGYFGPRAVAAEAPVRMDFILPAGTNSFMRMLHGHLLQEAEARGDVAAQVHQVELWSPDRLADKLSEMHGRTDALGLVALDHPRVREEVNARQRDEREVVRHDEAACAVPAGAIENEARVGAGGRRGATARPISARCAFIASVSAKGMARPAATPRAGQAAPKM